MATSRSENWKETTVTSRYRITVDRSVCQGSGLCVGIASGFFALDGTHRSAPLKEVVDANDDVLDAAECCPTEAITVVDADTNEPVTT
jgi:ferredoxin